MSAPRPHSSRARWVICALLFSATLINYVDRQTLALLKGILDNVLGWKALDYGLVNSAFQGAYALSVLFFGWFVDRFGIKIGYAVSAGAWSVMAVAHAAVSSVSGFLWARVGLGLGEGGNFPAAIKCVALWFPRHERAFATSLVNCGANAGAFVAPAIIPGIALAWGWRSAFVLAGLAGFVWLVAWLVIYETPRPDQDHAEVHQSPGGVHLTAKTASWRSLLRRKETWAFLSAKFLTDPVWWFFLIWLPDLFKRSYGLGIRESGAKLVSIYAMITALSVAGAWLTGRLVTRGWTVTRARKTVMLACGFCVLPVWIIPSLDVWPAVLLIGLAGAAHQTWSANLFTTVSDIFPNPSVASVTGLGSLAGAIGGMLFPLYCGYVLDSFRAQGNESGAYAYLLHLCAFVYVITFAIHHLLAPKFEPVPAKVTYRSGPHTGS